MIYFLRRLYRGFFGYPRNYNYEFVNEYKFLYGEKAFIEKIKPTLDLIREWEEKDL